MFTREFDLADYLSRQLVRSSYLVNQVCDLFKRLTLIHFLIWYFHWKFPYLNKSNIWSEFVAELYHQCKDLPCALRVIEWLVLLKIILATRINESLGDELVGWICCKVRMYDLIVRNIKVKDEPCVFIWYCQ